MTRVAAVTGGAGAIGGAIAAGLRAGGHEVAILDLNGDPAVDLAERGEVQAAAAAVLARHGHCDVLVHAAAAFDRASLLDLEPEVWHRVQAVNVESALWLAQALVPGMAERGFGRIVFVVSDTVWDPPAGHMLPYVASKAALIGIARTLARSLGRDGITVNCVAPGLTPTPTAVAGLPPEAFAAVRARQAIGRALTPDDIAAAVTFLVSDAAGAITGQTLCADGGLVHSGGFLLEVDGPRAVDHLDALCFGKTDRAVLQAFADGLPEVAGFLASLGGATAPVDLAAFGGMLPSWPHFPGAGHVRYRQFTPADGGRAGIGLWRVLEAAVRGRGVPVALDCPVRDLVLEAGRVAGAIVEFEGDPVRIGVRRGVVLASGSFGADAELRDTYLPLPLVSVGHPGNTGDTIRLAQAAGASLWHMSAFFGWLSFVHPDYPAAFTLDVHAPSFIYLDGDGRRFADETGWEVHDRVRALTAYLPRRLNRPRLPGWIVFDEDAHQAGPLHGIVGSPNGYDWSPDNSAEVAAGWIKRGESPAELAAAIGLDPPALEATLAGYAQAVSLGRDEEFGRAAHTLAPLVPPLYAIAMWPGVATASGGPRRDARARVLDRHGQPVPGLFAAGAAGSIWGHLTEHGGGLTDAIVFGRLAGAGAAGRTG